MKLLKGKRLEPKVMWWFMLAVGEWCARQALFSCLVYFFRLLLAIVPHVLTTNNALGHCRREDGRALPSGKLETFWHGRSEVLG